MILHPIGEIRPLLGFDSEGADRPISVHVHANVETSPYYPIARVSLESRFNLQEGSIACMTSRQARVLAAMLLQAADAADAACADGRDHVEPCPRCMKSEGAFAQIDDDGAYIGVVCDLCGYADWFAPPKDRTEIHLHARVRRGGIEQPSEASRWNIARFTVEPGPAISDQTDGEGGPPGEARP